MKPLFQSTVKPVTLQPVTLPVKSLFQSTVKPVTLPPGTPEPKPGPNAVEVMVAQYDPDQNLVVVSLPGDVQLAAKLDDMPQEGSQPMTLLLDDTKLGPRIELRIFPRTALPKFSSPEEADAWLEANS